MEKDTRTPDERNTFEYTISNVTIRYKAGVTNELALKQAVAMLRDGFTPLLSYSAPVVRVRTITIKQSQQTVE